MTLPISAPTYWPTEVIISDTLERLGVRHLIGAVLIPPGWSVYSVWVQPRDRMTGCVNVTIEMINGDGNRNMKRGGFFISVEEQFGPSEKEIVEKVEEFVQSHAFLLGSGE